MELQDVIRKRRMVRTYDLSRPIPRAIVDRLLQNAVRAPSAGFSQGWAFLVLDDREEIDKFRRAVTPGRRRMASRQCGGTIDHRADV